MKKHPQTIRAIGFVLLSILLTTSFFAKTAVAIEVPDAEYRRGPLPPEQAFIFSYVNQGDGKIILDWQIAEYYYMYKDKFLITSNNGSEFDISFSDNDQPYEDEFFGDIRVYRQNATLALQLDQENQPDEINLVFQGCWDGGVCYPPRTVILNLDNNSVNQDIATGEQSAALGSVVANANTFDSKITNTQQQLDTEKDIDFTSLLNNEENQNFFLDTINDANLLWLIIIFFVSGLALTFTPCVFPTIPLVSGIITKSTNITPMRGFLMTSTFVLSSSITYSLIGVLVGFLGQNLQVLLQQPWIIVLSAMLFVLLAMVMFGLFTLQIPLSIQNKINSISNKQNTGSYYGLATMGVLSTLIVGPCLTAPLAGILIYLGGQGSPLQGGLSLFALGLGMGTPLIIAGTAAGRLLPKAGAWLAKIQHIFGFIMLLMAVWMLERILPEGLALLLYGIVLVFFGIHLWDMGSIKDQSSKEHAGLLSFIKGSAIIVTLIGILQIVGYSTGSIDVYQPLKSNFLTASVGSSTAIEKIESVTITSTRILDQQVRSASQLGKPVLVKFEAKWCIECKQIDRTVFSDSQVIDGVGQTYYIRADVSEVNDDALQLLDLYDIPGPPAILFFDKSGNYRSDLLLLGNITKKGVLANLAKVIS